MTADERCPKHEGGVHCWHSYGTTGYKGKYEMRIPVKCCHCGKRAAQVRFVPPEAIEYE
jgi:hypothetical protein